MFPQKPQLLLSTHKSTLWPEQIAVRDWPPAQDDGGVGVRVIVGVIVEDRVVEVDVTDDKLVQDTPSKLTVCVAVTPGVGVDTIGKTTMMPPGRLSACTRTFSSSCIAHVTYDTKCVTKCNCRADSFIESSERGVTHILTGLPSKEHTNEYTDKVSGTKDHTKDASKPTSYRSANSFTDGGAEARKGI